MLTPEAETQYPTGGDDAPWWPDQTEHRSAGKPDGSRVGIIRFTLFLSALVLCAALVASVIADQYAESLKHQSPVTAEEDV